MTATIPLPTASPLVQPVITLRGVGPERAELLKRLGILTIEDLLLHRPRRYEDRRHLRTIAELTPGELGITRGTIIALGVKWFARRTKSIFEIVLNDGSARLHCRWWNLPFMEKNFQKGEELVVCGKLKDIRPRAMEHPEVEIVEAGEEIPIHLNRITPVYPLTEGLTQRWLRGLVWRTLEKLQVEGCKLQVTSGIAALAQPSTCNLQLASGLPTRAEAIRNLHFPQELLETEAARRRLAFDEFVELQMQIQGRRKNFQTKSRALPCRGDNRLMKPFLAKLGFRLTDAQTKVLRELRADMSAEHPMRRLLQGDVGSGKTVVAACTGLMALESSYDVAVMAPTEILAEQHFNNFLKWFSPLGIKVELRTGAVKMGNDGLRITEHGPTGGKLQPSSVGPLGTGGRRKSSRGLAALQDAGARIGSAAIGAEMASARSVTLYVGTHALIHSGFVPENLGLVVIDEQHRFGVAQREQLVRKGYYPHLLVMTATPIPRTLGLTLYGDLDVSVLESPPAGRGRIRTFIRKADKLPEVWEFIRSQLANGRQAYVVYARVEETGESGTKAVAKEFAKVQQALKQYQVGLIHGQLRAEEKEAVMAGFRANRTQVLLATSLIEVGVDVPNATVMLIENAEQFGLAQLHQLRGRIGRGAHDSYCILVATAQTREAQQRLKVLEQTNDGFEIAEADLKLRGPGELLGQQQSGMPNFRFGDLVNDLDLIKQAKAEASIQTSRPGMVK